MALGEMTFVLDMDADGVSDTVRRGDTLGDPDPDPVPTAALRVQL